jgi:hypothetical protein
MGMARTRGDEGGVALPMALVALALLTSLMLALASLAQVEPVIAANHVLGSQARTLAESGLELALWALATPASAGGAAPPAPAGAPFDGGTFFGLGPGGFTVEIAAHPGGDPHRRTVTSVGWAPTNSATDPRPRAHRRVVVDVAAIPPLGRQAPCALCVRGGLEVSGSVTIDGRNADAGCGGDTKHGALSTQATTLAGGPTLAGGAGPGDQHRPVADLERVTLSPAALEALRTLAWRNGTYYGPGFPRGGPVSDGGSTWSGRIAFDASTPLRDGVVFVDTTDGRHVAGAADAATLAGVRLDATAVVTPPGVFRGWIVVNGSLDVTGGVHVRGVVYTVDTLGYRATGVPARIDGLVVSLNVRDAGPARLEASGGGALALVFDCAAVAGPVPAGVVPLPGTYREE